MGIYSRYKFLKRMNKNKIVLIKNKKRNISFDEDLMILNSIKFKGNFRILDQYEMDYIVLDNLDVINEVKFVNNNYNKFLKISYLNKMLITR